MKHFFSALVVIPVIASGLLFASPLPPQRVDVSGALRALMNQVEQTYLARNGYTFGAALNGNPDGAARLLGIGMMPQAEYSRQSQTNRRRYLGLIDEIKGFLRQLAQIHQNDPNSRRRVTYEQLWDAFKEGFTGKNNRWAIDTFGVDPFAVRQPSILHLADDPGLRVNDERARLPMGERSNGAVNLLGERAGRVEGAPRPNPPTPPPPQPQESKYRWQALGIYQNPTWWGGSYKQYSTFGNPEKPVVSSITECCDSTRGCPERNNVKVVPCSAVRGNCVMKVQLLKDSYLGRKGEIKCILRY